MSEIKATSLAELLEQSPTAEIQSMFAKHYSRIREEYQNIMVSVSGGSDSDILVDMIERIGHEPDAVKYVFFDTGIEFAATKRHLDYLANKYGIEIKRQKAYRPIPSVCAEYGQPFLPKRVSEYIYRLQKHGFRWEDKPFDELIAEYPNCKVALRWWCNEWGEGSHFNIKRNAYLKEFMVQNPPEYDISAYCCIYGKKKTAAIYRKMEKPDLQVIGVRKYEGGTRATAYKTCFDESDDCAQMRPLLWLKDNDKALYNAAFGITNSDCYTVYGLRRTGCVCCPFSQNLEHELKAAEQYEPKLYKAVCNIFGKSFEYTKKYREFVKQQKQKDLISDGQISLFQ